jgi:hypothetical protein
MDRGDFFCLSTMRKTIGGHLLSGHPHTVFWLADKILQETICPPTSISRQVHPGTEFHYLE